MTCDVDGTWDAPHLEKKAKAIAFHRPVWPDQDWTTGGIPPPSPEPVIHYPIKPLGPAADLLLGLSFYLKMTVDITI